ncbi:DUF5682 family protein [Nonomuraea sp. NPDC059023]|uniref:DUF5682 family protein n=1 Tax=unclassified Nonomuraea TaxID=2593643 RepID=UPI00367E064F
MSPFDPLREQLASAAETFGAGLIDDVEQALRTDVEIFPVCHHSPASGLAMVRRLREKQPKVIYLELCEDLRPVLDELHNCKLPVALQAFATDIDGFPKEWAPLSVVAPITESSAEYQAIAYALDTPGVEIVLVDRSVDHVFQWEPRAESADVGIEIGDLRPGFAALEEHLLHHGKVRHWSEWWDQYVEQPLSGADYETYRQVMVLIGSLFRRIKPGGNEVDEDRERYMWTRMREHLAATGADPADCLYVCGAFHAASPVMDETLDISPRTKTSWLYGLIPSSHSAIENQFGLAPGSVSIAAATWDKSLKRHGLASYQLGSKRKGKTPAPVESQGLHAFLTQPPVLDGFDEAELLGWCVEIVRLARRNGYLASTADAIAVFETSILLAGMRNRKRPTPYDFQDAAVTCIEKDVVPGRRDVRRLVEIMLGGDKVGQVGYDSLPPLARDVLDRLKPLGLDLEKRTIQRALIDLDAHPELEPCSHLLWILRRLLPDDAVRPIMGSRRLGERSHQESWDLSIGRNQRSIIELGYEGVTIEQVLEQRLRRAVWDPKATASVALDAVEDSILYLGSRRFTDELGARAIQLLSGERTVDDAPDVLRRIRRLLAHYRATEPELPEWAKAFVTTGYAHYCTLLPTAFVEEETGVRQVGAMLGFLFTMESLALSLGCDRAQLELAVQQSHPTVPAKVALLWTARYQLGLLSMAELRELVGGLLGSPLVVPSVPQYVSGFVQALESAPALAPFVVEVLSRAFGQLPDDVLLPWLPKLITALREQAPELVPVLVREAERTFPARLGEVDSFTPPWLAKPSSRRAVAVSGPVSELLAAHPATGAAVGELLGCEPVAGLDAEIGALLAAYPATGVAVAGLLT